MPIYEYRCRECGHQFEHLLPTRTAPVPPCPECGAQAPSKLFSTFSPTVAAPKSPCGTGQCAAANTCPSGGCPLSAG